jgi:chaperonin GroES
MTTPNVKILGYRVLVAPIPSNPDSTIVVPDVAKETETEGRIAVIGDGYFRPDMKAEFKVAVGDHVVFSSYGGQDLLVGGVRYWLISAEDIIAIRLP